MLSPIGNHSPVSDFSAMRSMFARLDQDGDGKITKVELKASMPQDGTGPSVNDIFSQVDTNGDDAIDASENDAWLQKMEAGHRPHRPDLAKVFEEIFAGVDADSDGKISQDELTKVLPQQQDPTMIEDFFQKADVDGDGSISKSELADFLKMMLERLQANRQQSPPTGYGQTGAAIKATSESEFSVLA